MVFFFQSIDTQVLPVPEDLAAYVSSLPGVTGLTSADTTVDGEAAVAHRFAIGDLPDAPVGVCEGQFRHPGLLAFSSPNGGICLWEGSDALVLEVPSAAFVVVASWPAGPGAIADEVAAIVASIDFDDP